MAHTLTYEVGIDQEIQVENKLYYATIDLDVDFNDDAEAQRVEVTKCEVSMLDEDSTLPWTTEGKRLEKIIIEGNPELTAALDQILWEEIWQYAEDNYADIHREVETDHDEMKSLWNSDL